MHYSKVLQIRAIRCRLNFNKQYFDNSRVISRPYYAVLRRKLPPELHTKFASVKLSTAKKKSAQTPQHRRQLQNNSPDRVPFLGEAIIQAGIGWADERAMLAHVELGHLVLLLRWPHLYQASSGQINDQHSRNILEKHNPLLQKRFYF